MPGVLGGRPELRRGFGTVPGGNAASFTDAWRGSGPPSLLRSIPTRTLACLRTHSASFRSPQTISTYRIETGLTYWIADGSAKSTHGACRQKTQLHRDFTSTLRGAGRATTSVNGIMS